MAQGRSTIRDVAAKAGVSITTVSHVLNDVPGKRVNPDTRDRVRAAAAMLGYAPNAMAQSLRTQRTGTVGLLGDEVVTTPFAGKIILGVQDVAMAHDSILLVMSTGYTRQVEEREIAELKRRQVDGVLYTAMYHREVEIPAELAGTPLVLINAPSSDPQVPSIIPDELAGGRDATEVLLAAGHRRIAMVNNVDDIPAARLREQGFREAASAAGLSDADVAVVTTAADFEGGFEAARELLGGPDRPTGTFSFNDRIAQGVYGAALSLGLRIPDDLSVVGFDDQEYVANGLYPGLTTVALQHYEMGVWAAEQLFARIEEPAARRQPAPHHMLRGPVVHRGSVTSPPW